MNPALKKKLYHYAMVTRKFDSCKSKKTLKAA